MTSTVELPVWLFILILLFAGVTFASHFLFPSVRWYLRRRFERAVARLNERLTRPIEPFKLTRRYDMIQRLIYDPEVSQAIADYAQRNKVPENVAFQKARRYAREIVPSFSAFAYFGFGIRVARLIANALYEVRTGPNNDMVLKDVPADATVIFVMNHRSNMDYLIVTYLAANASALSYAVGEWARVWPLSRLIKSMGAYFIRRRSRGLLYRKVLARYVHLATQNGVTQAIFPEGGLSLNGKVMPPKLGLLSYVVEAVRADGREVAFIPVAINYDRVLEDRVLIAADQGGERRFRARISVILWFILKKSWLRLRGRFLRFGTAAVVFGDPVLISSFGTAPDAKDLAQDLMARIEDEMPLLFVPLLARIMLAGPVSKDELAEVMSAELHRASPLGPRPVENWADAVARARDHLLQRGMIVAQGDTLAAEPEEVAVLRYYANSIAHFYADHAAPAK